NARGPDPARLEQTEQCPAATTDVEQFDRGAGPCCPHDELDVISQCQLPIDRLEFFQRFVPRLRRAPPVLSGIEAGDFLVAGHWIQEKAPAGDAGMQGEMFRSAFKKKVAAGEG